MEIEEFEWDDANSEHISRHRVTVNECNQVIWGEDYFVRPNKKGTAQTHVVIGRTFGGRWLFIPIRPTNQPGVWRPASARTAEVHETQR